MVSIQRVDKKAEKEEAFPKLQLLGKLPLDRFFKRFPKPTGFWEMLGNQQPRPEGRGMLFSRGG
jgi:hypothetical protein